MEKPEITPAKSTPRSPRSRGPVAWLRGLFATWLSLGGNCPCHGDMYQTTEDQAKRVDDSASSKSKS
jgi:hypothetical protein